ncbi:MAG: AAA family ATPase, partial [Actinobacteria bacterium]|nr:AAA family ATPase [Actinomycetota bacterium]
MTRSREGVDFPGLPRVWPLVGRSAELAAIADAVGRPDVSGVVLVGEPGVGKTRLAREGLEIARKAGFTTGQAAASQAAASIPLGALAPLLPDLSAEGATDAVRRAVDALGALTASGPYMLLVDDAHLLDSASATVLHHLATDTPVSILVTVRAGEGAPDPVAALWKDDLAVRIDVGPLDAAGAEALVTGALGAPVEGRTMSDLFRVSGGNPLFLRELVLGASGAGLLLPEEGIWRLRASIITSPRLTELVEARLTDLSDDERGALEVVAFGEPLALDHLLLLASVTDVEALEAQGLVALDGGSGRRSIMLAHPLHGEVLRANIGPLRAMAVQRRLAETLIAAGPLTDEDALRVAIWMVESDGEIPLESVVRAAWRARFAGDDALAARLGRAAFDAGGGIDAAQVLGEALLATGHADEAVEVLTGVDGADLTEDQFALASLTRAEALFTGLGRAAEGRAVLELAMRRVADEGWRGEIIALNGTYILFEGHPLEAIQAVSPLLSAASPRAAVSAATVAAP